MAKLISKKIGRHTHKGLEEVEVLRGSDSVAVQYWDQFNGTLGSLVHALERGRGWGEVKVGVPQRDSLPGPSWDAWGKGVHQSLGAPQEV